MELTLEMKSFVETDFLAEARMTDEQAAHMLNEKFGTTFARQTI